MDRSIDCRLKDAAITDLESVIHAPAAFARRAKQISDYHHGSSKPSPRHNDTPPLALYLFHVTQRSLNEQGEFVFNNSPMSKLHSYEYTKITEQDPSDMKPAKKMWE
ncbi:hypothetical protein TrVFT333_010247 [Trichoderma virens FT-333]|nr:hypothetical protein TrVFT333_010247 [Trichoderma virens FT-333]